MLRPAPILLLATALGVAAVTSTPSCASSPDGYPVGQVNYLFNNFCTKLGSNGFTTTQQIYGLPVISFDFAVGSGSACDVTNCLASYQTIVQACQLPNATIWGTGSLDAGCGTYKFTIGDSAVALGAASTTLQGATMTTAAIITSTSSSSSSTSSLSTSSSVTTTSSSSPSLTSTSTSVSLSPTSLSLLYSNSTSMTSTSSSGVASGTGSVVLTSSAGASQTTGGSTASVTKPVVGSTALGSGAGVLRASGLGLVGVACLFGLFL